jgi:hypothetical protein
MALFAGSARRSDFLRRSGPGNPICYRVNPRIDISDWNWPDYFAPEKMIAFGILYLADTATAMYSTSRHNSISKGSRFPFHMTMPGGKRGISSKVHTHLDYGFSVQATVNFDGWLHEGI